MSCILPDVDLQTTTFTFLHRNNLEGKPLLLGLSGGPDSMALFHLLLKLNISFGVAHVNHRWRQESDEEERVLSELCREKNIPFFLKRLDPSTLSGNLEDASRQERMRFFREVCKERGYEALLLAHHSSDAAETVLKRVFEGASLPKLKGLTPLAYFHELLILRPLLSHTKKELLAWLDGEKISYFKDATNEDERYLRARMRKTLLPLLSHHFGKEIEPSLRRLGEAAEELQEFLNSYLAPYHKNIIKNEGGLQMDVADLGLKTKFEIKALVRLFLEEAHLTVSNPVMETILLHLERKSPYVEVQVGQKKLFILKGMLKTT